MSLRDCSKSCTGLNASFLSFATTDSLRDVVSRLRAYGVRMQETEIF